MRVRYKSNPSEERHASRFNPFGMSEVVTGDDSIFIQDLEVYVEAREEWKCLHQAFRDRDVITDNHNTEFFKPKTEADRQRGYTL